MLYNFDHFIRPFRILLFLNIHGDSGALSQGSGDKDKKKPPTVTTSVPARQTTVPSTSTAVLNIPTTGPTVVSEPLPTTTTALSLSIPPTGNLENPQSGVSPSENDPRVGWVYHLPKSDVQSHLKNHNLDSEGNLTELRKRLVKYIRSIHPAEYDATSSEASNFPTLHPPIRTITTIASQPYSDTTKVTYSNMDPYYFLPQNSYERDSVRELLGLPPTATFRMVQEKLSELRKPLTTTTFETNLRSEHRNHSLPYENLTNLHGSDPNFGFHTEPASSVTRNPTIHLAGLANRSCTEPSRLRQNHLNPEFSNPNRSNTPFDSPLNDVAKVCNQVRKWNLRFNGNQDPVSFIERLNELAESYDVLPDLLLKALPELLTGEALFWYRNNKLFWTTFDDFLISFEEQYLPPDYRQNLEAEITRRTQGENEPVRKFIVALTTLIRRSGGFSNHQLLNRLYSNLRPEYKLTLRRDSFQSVSELIRLAEGYESYVRETKLYRPPPNPAQSMVPETAYDSRNRVLKSYPVQSVQSHNRQAYNRTPNRPNNTNFESRNIYHSNHSNYNNDSQPFNNELQPCSIKSFSNTSTGVETSIPTRTIPSNPPPVNPRVDQRHFPRSENRKPVSNIVCWNCDKIGHRFGDCNLPKVLRCFNCKKEGVLTTKCPCRSENACRDRKPRGVPSLENQN